MIQSFCKQRGYAHEVLRLEHVYGEGEEKYRKIIPVMLKNAISGNDITIYGDGETKRTFIYIDDVVKAMIRSLELETSEVINIVVNEVVTINGLVKIIGNISDNKFAVRHIQTELPDRDYLFDNSKLRICLLANQISLRDGLQNEYNYIKRIECA